MFLRRAADVWWWLAGRWRKLPTGDGSEGDTLVLDANQDLVWGAAGAPVDEPFLTFAADSGALTNNRVVVAGASGWIVLTDAGVDDGDFEIEIGTLAENQLLGRGNGSGTGVPEAITLGTGLSMTGNVLSSTGGGGGGGAPDNATYVVISNDATLTNERALAVESSVLSLTDGGADTTVTIGIATNGVTFAKMQQISTARLLGRSTSGTGNIEQIEIGLGLSIGAGQLIVATDGISNTMLRNSAGFSVIGKATTGSGDPADIVAGTDSVLGRQGSGNLAFSTIVTNQIGAAQVTLAKIQNATANSVLVGAGSAGSGASYSQITLGTGLSMSGTVLSSSITQYTDEMAQDAVGGILTDSSTIDFTYNDGANTITAIVIDGSITMAKLANLATQRVIGRNTGGTGVPEAVTASQVLDWVGSTLGSVLYRDSGGWNVLGPGTNGFFLKTLGAGSAPVWAAVSATPAGSNTQVQYNNSGAFGAEAVFNYSAADNRLSVPELNLESGGSPGSGDIIGRIIFDTNTSLALWMTLGLVENMFWGIDAGNASHAGAVANIGLGRQALRAITGSANSNVAIGDGAGFGITGAENNVCLGASAGFNITTGGSNTCLGKGSDVSSGTIARSVALGSDSIASINDSVAIAGRTIEMDEMTAPAGASNKARLFCRDNGSGKSQLCVIFGSGAVQVLATEP